MKKLEQNGSHAVALALIVVVIGVVGFVGWRVMNKNASSRSSSAENSAEEAGADAPSKWPMNEDVTWENTSEGGWAAIYGTPPECPEPLVFTPPTDISKATSMLYPGQTRRGTFEGQGGNYKPHGGFRFDGLEYNDVKVTLPFDGFVYRGAQFLQDGEIQYTFDIINPCGILVRLGHLRELSPTFQALADKFPEAKELDSRTEKIIPMLKVKTGDVIATGVGFKNTKNIAFDWGVYDMRQQNEASKSAAYKTEHADASELAFYAVCWFDMLPETEAKLVKSLPSADPDSGKNSDYCK